MGYHGFNRKAPSCFCLAPVTDLVITKCVHQKIFVIQKFSRMLDMAFDFYHNYRIKGVP